MSKKPTAVHVSDWVAALVASSLWSTAKLIFHFVVDYAHECVIIRSFATEDAHDQQWVSSPVLSSACARLI
jgi:hypothetical protein